MSRVSTNVNEEKPLKPQRPYCLLRLSTLTSPSDER
jgi:hypothetical protein